MELSQAHLRYLLAIGELSQGKAAVSSTQVARVLQVSRPSVTRMLAVLAEKDLVTKERYGKITLTETGAALAHQLQAGLRDLERRLPALGLDLDREETAAVAGALASALGYILWYALVPCYSIAAAAAAQLSVPVITALGAVVFVGEAITLRLVLCSAAILGGIFIVALWGQRHAVPRPDGNRCGQSADTAPRR